ncbi:MAG TPA: A/G-specific adenine glycosylase [Thermoplasmata archaeon]|nr:A/G-specific adenine glycosylase [Thermoplasmata archaeon]
MDGPSPREVQALLLPWFDAGHRDMPWRRTTDPYRILLAEYLLQRTRVATGRPYYERFLERFPTVEALAAAPEEDVLHTWEGLGYYRRARNLLAAAKSIVRDHGGRIPTDSATLATLPGIGPYTAGAVASIAFGERIPAVDGNVTRVVTRLFRVEVDVTSSPGRARIQELAHGLVPVGRSGPFNQAMMELGATVCTPRSPRCSDCPFVDLCLAHRAGIESTLPRILARRRPRTVPVAFAYVVSRGRTLLVRRGSREILGGLWSLPGGELPSGSAAHGGLRSLVSAQTGLAITVRGEVARVAHAFSHRRWSGAVFACSAQGRLHASAGVRWVTPDEARRLPLVPFHREVLEDLAARPRIESYGRSRRRREA